MTDHVLIDELSRLNDAVLAKLDGLTGTVPWWPGDRRHPTLETVLAHVTVETARHAGHLDIVRETIDGAAGRFPGDLSMPGDDELDWVEYVATVEAAARAAAD